MIGRRGTTLAEALVAMTLGLLVLHLAITTLHRIDGAVSRTKSRQDAIMSARIARSVMRGELRHAHPPDDWIVHADSVVVRAFRGAGTICAADSVTAEVLVSYQGGRLPEPLKDSVELLVADGSLRYADLTASSETDEVCPFTAHAERSLRLRLDAPAPGDALALRVYEKGSYHISGSALRYRSGRGGRQPLTPEALDDARSSWTISARSFGWSVMVDDLPERWGGFLGWIEP